MESLARELAINRMIHNGSVELGAFQFIALPLSSAYTQQGHKLEPCYDLSTRELPNQEWKTDAHRLKELKEGVTLL